MTTTSSHPSQPSRPSRPTTTLTARSPEDLLAAAAVVLGFWPTESVVMLTVAARHRFHARIDLPGARDAPAALAEMADALARPAVQHGADRVVLLLYSTDDDLAAAAWTVLRETFDAAGVAVVEAVRVAAERWHPLLGRDAGGGAGVALDPAGLAAHPFLAQSVLDGRVTRGSRADLVASLAPDPAAVEAVEAVVAAPATTTPAGERAEVAWARATVERHLDAGTRPTDAEAARLLRAVRSVRVRDAAWSALTQGRVRAAVDLLTDLVRRSPDHLRAPVAALLGWAAWQAGDGALAWCAVDRCREVDPDHPLADLVAQALERAVPPSAWHDG